MSSTPSGLQMPTEHFQKGICQNWRNLSPWPSSAAPTPGSPPGCG